MVSAIAITVCFKNRLKNTYIKVATQDIAEAKRIARIWGEKDRGEPVTRTIFKEYTSLPDEEIEIIDGIKVWPLPF